MGGDDAPVRLVRDGTGARKLSIFLSGTRYQLSLADSAVVFLENDGGITVGETVPKPFAVILIAMGSAWFPNQRDTESILRDVSAPQSVPGEQKTRIKQYVTDTYITKSNVENVLQALEMIGIETITEEELLVNTVEVNVEELFGTEN